MSAASVESECVNIPSVVRRFQGLAFQRLRMRASQREAALKRGDSIVHFCLLLWWVFGGLSISAAGPGLTRRPGSVHYTYLMKGLPFSSIPSFPLTLEALDSPSARRGGSGSTNLASMRSVGTLGNKR